MLDSENGKDSSIPGAFDHIPVLDKSGSAVILCDPKVSGFLDILFAQILRADLFRSRHCPVEQLGKIFIARFKQKGCGRVLFHILPGNPSPAPMFLFFRCVFFHRQAPFRRQSAVFRQRPLDTVTPAGSGCR